MILMLSVWWPFWDSRILDFNLIVMFYTNFKTILYINSKLKSFEHKPTYDNSSVMINSVVFLFTY